MFLPFLIFLVFFFRFFLMRPSRGNTAEGHRNVPEVPFSTQYALVPRASVSSQEMLPQLFAPRASIAGRSDAVRAGKIGEQTLLASFRFSPRRRPRQAADALREVPFPAVRIKECAVRKPSRMTSGARAVYSPRQRHASYCPRRRRPRSQHRWPSPWPSSSAELLPL